MADLSEVNGEDLVKELSKRLTEGETSVEDGIKSMVTDHFKFEDLYPDESDEIEALEKENEELKTPAPAVEEIMTCAARIAFGDFTDLPSLKLLFVSQGVHGVHGVSEMWKQE